MWRADLWLERLVFDRIACRLTAAPAVAVRAQRALLIGATSLDLADASPELAAAIASLLAAARRDDTGIGRTARAASGAEVAEAAFDRLVARLRGAAGADEPGAAFVHVSLDMDVVDPEVAPGVGTPVRGGLSYREAHLAMELVAESELLDSLEVVEVNPILDRQNETAALAVELAASALGARIL